MKDKIEWNNLKLEIDLMALHQSLENSQDPVFQLHRHLPWMAGKLRITPTSFYCESLPSEDHRILKGSTEIIVDHPDWNVKILAYLTVQGSMTKNVFQWTDAEIIRLEKVEMGSESEFQIDGHSIHLVPTLNKLISLNLSKLVFKAQEALPGYITNLSEKYFGSPYLVELLEVLFFKVDRSCSDDHIRVGVSASEMKNHFEDAIDIPPYIFMKMPVDEFQYLLSHIPIPALDIRGYMFVVSSVEVLGDNELLVNLYDANKKVDIAIRTALELKDNVLYPEVITLDIDGLGWFQSAMFRVLKKMIIRKIEDKPLDISSQYRSLLVDLSRRYPFLRIQEGKNLVVQKLDISREGLSLFIHFPDDQRV